ncbi:hypothetical protein GWK47_017452 [Chionoecetes opilio]|uniref:Uncharacterized protein n=1 Tax=Chionoecetes opilio TaxID=41210 RepID=A0A8J4XTW5_CHIOP|nr:hypothetical protein GWK47_017452 [Chionoecetes opilio]
MQCGPKYPRVLKHWHTHVSPSSPGLHYRRPRPTLPRAESAARAAPHGEGRRTPEGSPDREKSRVVAQRWYGLQSGREVDQEAAQTLPADHQTTAPGQRVVRYEAWVLVGVWGAPGLSSRGSWGPGVEGPCAAAAASPG